MMEIMTRQGLAEESVAFWFVQCAIALATYERWIRRNEGPCEIMDNDTFDAGGAHSPACLGGTAVGRIAKEAASKGSIVTETFSIMMCIWVANYSIGLGQRYCARNAPGSNGG